MIIVILLVLMSLVGPNQASTYYGPPLSDAKYTEVFSFSTTNGESSRHIDVDSSWIGIRLTAEFVGTASLNISAVSPDGVILASIVKENIANQSVNTVRSFNPSMYSGKFVGQWTLEYKVTGNPVNITVMRVDSFGTPP
ncbi:MAG: hypothetical protein SA339_10245 [Methanomassiliicoccus sp.]|nr:hypothetical protein [Methanomassiliicoccus sp.]